jgi:hypothetical protein
MRREWSKCEGPVKSLKRPGASSTIGTVKHRSRRKTAIGFG